MRKIHAGDRAFAKGGSRPSKGKDSDDRNRLADSDSASWRFSSGAERLLLYEFSGVADHRQVDEFRAAVVVRCEADDKVAEIDAVHAFQRRDQLFAGQVLPGALESLDHHLADDVPLEAGEVEVSNAGISQYLLVFLHDWNARAPGKRHDLRNRDPVAFVLERVGERLAADERDVVELGRAPGVFHLPDEFGDRSVGRDHDHSVGLDGIDRLRGAFHIDRIAFHLAQRGDLHVALGHGKLDALQTGLPVGIVLVEHGDLVVASGDQLFDDLLGLVVVARTHVEDVAIHRIAQHFGTGEGPHQRDLGLGEDRHRSDGGGGADVGDQSEDLVLFDERPGVFDAEARLVSVIARLELDLPAVYTALGIDRVEVRLGTEVHLDTQLGGRTGKGRRLAEQNRFGGDAWNLRR